MFVTELEVINACLATLGEAPLNTMEDDHSFKAAAQDKLNTTNLEVQKLGFWFNTEHLDLIPDATDGNFIYVPQDVLEVRPLVGTGAMYAQRGRRLFNVGENSYAFTNAVCVRVVRLLPFEDLPYHAAAAVRDEATLRFQHVYDGDAVRYRELTQMAMLSRAQLMAEEVRQRKPNLLNRPTMRAVMEPSLVGYVGIPHPLR